MKTIFARVQQSVEVPPICAKNACPIDAEKTQGHNEHNRTDTRKLFQ